MVIIFTWLNLLPGAAYRLRGCCDFTKTKVAVCIILLLDLFVFKTIYTENKMFKLNTWRWKMIQTIRCFCMLQQQIRCNIDNKSMPDKILKTHKQVLILEKYPFTNWKQMCPGDEPLDCSCFVCLMYSQWMNYSLHTYRPYLHRFI